MFKKIEKNTHFKKVSVLSDLNGMLQLDSSLLKYMKDTQWLSDLLLILPHFEEPSVLGLFLNFLKKIQILFN